MPVLAPGTYVTPSICLVRPLGAGGMGSVWLAQHLALASQVVVKFMAEALESDPTAVARFTREATAASQVRSPHVVQVLDHGLTGDRVPYIVMEFLEGQDLRGRITQRGRLGVTEVEHIMTQACRALSRAHEKGIVHRDIKPENIFLCDQGHDEAFVKLLDFGIAKGVDTIVPGTRTGALMGSPLYMSPEQLVGSKSMDHRTDLWSMAVVAYECLTGDVPFMADTIGGMALLVHAPERPSLRRARPDLPPSFDAWFVRASAKDPNARFQSAKELRDAFAAVAAEASGVPAAAPSMVGAPPPSVASFVGPAPIAAGPDGGYAPAPPYAAVSTGAGPTGTLHAQVAPVSAVTGPGAGTISPLHATAHPAAKPGGGKSALFVGAGVAAGMVTVAIGVAAVVLTGRPKDGAQGAGPTGAASGSAEAEHGGETTAAPKVEAAEPSASAAATGATPPDATAGANPASSATSTTKAHVPRPPPASTSKGKKHGPIF
jgi:serine/threonine-protein kinase